MKEGFRVFLLDKDPISSMILKSKLVEHDNWDVRAFHTPEECWRHLNNEPAVVVIHNKVSGNHYHNGIDLLKDMQLKRPATKFILLSDQYDRQLMFSLINNNSVNYISRNLPNYTTKVKELVEGMEPNQSRRNVA